MNVYINRENSAKWTLFQNNGEPVKSNSIVRVVLTFGSYKVDTNNTDDPIELIEDNTKIKTKLGLIPELAEGDYEGTLTVYDTLAPNGLAWGGKTKIKVRAWPN